MSADDPAAGHDVVFTPGRGYRAPLLRRSGIFLMLTVIAAFLAGSGVVPPLAWAATVLLGAAATFSSEAGYRGKLATIRVT